MTKTTFILLVISPLLATTGPFPVDPRDQQAAFQGVQLRAINQALSQQKMAASISLIDTEISRIVALRLSQHFFAGACIRDFNSPCPLRWTESPSTAATYQCFPPNEYEGPCKAQGAVLPVAASSDAKAEVAASCQAEWSCKICKKRYDRCPQRWTPVVGDQFLCKAPRDYDGICETSVDFSEISDFHKARWAARCRAVWTCDTSP